MSLTAVKTSAPTPPAASPLAGRDAAGTGLTVVEGAHWSDRLGRSRTAGWNDGWVLAIPLAGITTGVVIRYGWELLPYLAAAVLALCIVVSLLGERLEKVQKRQRRLARADR